MAYRNYSTSRSHIVDATGGGDFTTIQAAIDASVSGDSIFITSGIYEEDLVYAAGVTITAFDGDSQQRNVMIIGHGVISGPGKFVISNVVLQGELFDECIFITGSDATEVNLNFVGFYNPGSFFPVNYNVDNTSSVVILNRCYTDPSSVGGIIQNSIGTMKIQHCVLNWSDQAGIFMGSGILDIDNTVCNGPIFLDVITGPAFVFVSNCTIDSSSFNTYAIFSSIAPSQITNISISNSNILSGEIECINIQSSNAVATVMNCSLDSTEFASQAITGTGTLNYSFLTFTNTATTIDPLVTQNALSTFL